MLPSASPSSPTGVRASPPRWEAGAPWSVEKQTRSDSGAVGSRQALSSAPRGKRPVLSTEVAGETAEGVSPAPHANQSVHEPLASRAPVRDQVVVHVLPGRLEDLHEV